MKVAHGFFLAAALFSSMFFFTPRSFSQETEEKVFAMDPVVVYSSGRSPTASGHVADQVDVLTAEDLKNLPVKNLGEALSYMPGVDVQTSGPFGQASSVSIRGSYSRQVLVMVDGIPFNTQLSGQANLSRIPVESIQQIEVIKGGASDSWGSSLGGVINVITKPAGMDDKPHGSLATSYGSFGASKNSLQIDAKTGPVGYSSFGSFMHTGGNLADSRTQEVKNFTKLRYDLNQTTALNASFGYSGADLRYGPTTTNRIFEQPYISRYGALELGSHTPNNRLSLAYKYNDQDITTDTYNSSTLANVSSTVSHDAYQGVSVNNAHELSGGNKVTAGMDFDRHVLKSSSFLDASKSIDSLSPYANLLWHWGDLDVIPSVRYDHNSHFGSQLSPGFGMVYHVPGWEGLLRAKAARVFSAPPLLWVYNSDPALLVAPNPDLKAERAFLYEIGAEGPLPVRGLTGELNLYYSPVSDGVATVASGGLFQSRNFRKFIRQGVEVRLDYELTPRWDIFTAGSFNDVRNAQTDMLVRDAGIARQSFKWGSSYEWPCGLKVSLQGYYNRWASSPGQANDRKPVFDARLSEKIPDIVRDVDLEIFFNIYNLTNSKYWSSPVFPLSERSFEGGVSLSF